MPMQLTYLHIVKGRLILIFNNTNFKKMSFLGQSIEISKLVPAKNGYLKVSKLELIKHIPYAHPVADHGLS